MRCQRSDVRCQKLFFRVKYLNERLSNGLQRASVNMLHIVVDGVPGGTKAALHAVGVVGDDVDAGNAGHLVHRTMIIGDATAFVLWEETAVTRYAS